MTWIKQCTTRRVGKKIGALELDVELRVSFCAMVDSVLALIRSDSELNTLPHEPNFEIYKDGEAAVFNIFELRRGRCFSACCIPPGVEEHQAVYVFSLVNDCRVLEYVEKSKVNHDAVHANLRWLFLEK